ncbi:MAG: prepilin-type N-terminal cleavage/methylation domain-containing protein [Candidatus Omnitrophica bacterium]|nr:prepilin-type N-terminal cleavage/methylation domain-containing protein [Candidatus Omnitrophota bacterium]MDD5429261.1 prepilin-type N-terminal cleavage/methylation domain-containing protein [Candidatus Omnitrophota bacterium]
MRKGFTLIELIVVIAIIAVLAAIIAPNAFKAIEKANRSATMADYKSIKTAALAIYTDAAIWPDDGCEEAFLADDDCAGGTITMWDGPYLETWPSTTRFGGIYAYRNDALIDWDDDAGTAVNARYLALATAQARAAAGPVPVASAEKIDLALDGTADAAVGQVRYDDSLALVELDMLISSD